MKSSVLFDILNTIRCNYVVFNVFLSNNKTFFDLCISSDCFDNTIAFLKLNSITITCLNDPCLYGLKKINYVEQDNFVYRLFSRPAIRSLDYSWVPFNKIVENSFLANKNSFDNYYVLSPQDEFFYLICKNVFNNRDKGFDYNDVKRIKELNDLDFFLQSSKVIEMFKSVFFKFCPELLRLIDQNHLNDIFRNYISFKDY